MVERLIRHVVGAYVILFMYLLDSSTLFSQNDLCTPDCPQIEWSAEKVMVVSMAPEYPDCDVEVKYVEREGCNGGTKHDFQLTGSYSFLAGPQCEALRIALSTDGADAVNMLRLINEKAMKALIRNNFQTLATRPQCGQGQQISYRAFHGRCFLRQSMQEIPTTNGIYVSYITERCGDMCCIWLFGACYNPSSQQVEVKLLSPPDSGPPLCPWSRITPTEQCHGLCFDT